MPTHRSRNKMELKAHTSIHNPMEVREDEPGKSENFTHDRLGKKHHFETVSPMIRKHG